MVAAADSTHCLGRNDGHHRKHQWKQHLSGSGLGLPLKEAALHSLEGWGRGWKQGGAIQGRRGQLSLTLLSHLLCTISCQRKVRENGEPTESKASCYLQYCKDLRGPRNSCVYRLGSSQTLLIVLSSHWYYSVMY